VASFALESAAFAPGKAVPRKFTCDGADVSPALSWTNVPAHTASFALICDDPDAPMGTWVHWVIYGIPGGATGLPEGVAPSPTLPDRSKQGTNSWKKIGYGGPCPPLGRPHRYFFRLYALSEMLTINPGATKQQLQGAMEGLVLGTAELMGTYARA
jgi:Raf kinase inhibitor-like YbhB/YbcL family protein